MDRRTVLLFLRKALAAGCALVLLLSCAAAEGGSAPDEETVRMTFKKYKTSGGMVLAAKDGEIVYRQSYGWANKKAEEKISDDDILFDYKLKPGPAVSRNAIHLLKLMGFDEGIVKAAHKRADGYVETGRWE